MAKPLLSPLQFIMFSVMVGLATYMGISARSWEAVIPMLLLPGLICSNVLVYCIAMGLSQILGRFIKKDNLFSWCYPRVGICFLLGVLFMLVGPVERLYLVNADTYPRWLTTEMGTLDDTRLQQLRKQPGACHDHVPEIFRKSNGWIIRCGWFPFGQTYWVDSVAVDIKE